MVSSISTKKIFWNNSRGTSVPFYLDVLRLNKDLTFWENVI
jgi:hypothetical protein